MTAYLPSANGPPKDLVTPELFLGRRGACTLEFDVNNRKTNVK
jgi:hypothetical protein